MTTSTGLLRTGSNCWDIKQATRARLLVDGEEYFGAVYEALQGAQRSILILGWDIESRQPLVRAAPGCEPPPGADEPLVRVLNRVVSKRRGLHAHVLIWDFAMIYALERDWRASYEFGWRAHRRLHFRTDGHHPVGASQHQKVVVVDDAVAFVGGFDLAKWRWDTRAHRPGDPRRRDPDGHPYPPFHDIALMVEGPVARRLGDLARARWQLATGRKLKAVRPTTSSPWPPRFEAQFTDVMVGIARTLPTHRTRHERREVQQLYVDSIAAAKRWIYAENQYLTSNRLAQALAARLQEDDGPEVVLVLPERTGGWLERNTMDVLRSRFLTRLRQADRQGRLRVYYPTVAGLGSETLNVHAKVMVVDDRLLRVGSSNLSNRSMGLDSECDLVIDAGDDPHLQERVAAARNDLLAEHLGADTEQFAASLSRSGSLVATIESLRGGERTLLELDGTVSAELDRQVPDQAVIDPEQPLAPEHLAEQFLTVEQREHISHHGLRLAVFIAAVVAVALAWRWTPLGESLNMETVDGWIRDISASRFTPLILLGLYIVAGLVAFPLTVLVTATIFIFGPLMGFTYALSGSIASAMFTFWIGQLVGRDLLRRIAGSRIDRLNRWLANRGVLTMAAVRLIPIAPFTVVNLVAGASHITFRDYVLGTFIGMAPGIALMAVFLERVGAALRQPDAVTLVTVAVVGLGAVALLAGLRSWLRKRAHQQNASA